MSICHYLGNAGQLAQNNLLLILTIQHYSSHSSYIRKFAEEILTQLCFYSLIMPSPGFSMLYALFNVTKESKNKSNSQNCE